MDRTLIELDEKTIIMYDVSENARVAQVSRSASTPVDENIEQDKFTFQIAHFELTYANFS